MHIIAIAIAIYLFKEKQDDCQYSSCNDPATLMIIGLAKIGVKTCIWLVAYIATLMNVENDTRNSECKNVSDTIGLTETVTGGSYKIRMCHTITLSCVVGDTLQ